MNAHTAFLLYWANTHAIIFQSVSNYFKPVVSVFCRFYGLWMWFPQLFTEVENQGAVCERSGANHSIPLKNNTNDTGTDTKIYTDSFYTALSNIPGNIISIFLMDVIGRKAILCKLGLFVCLFGFFYHFFSKTNT